MESVEETDRSLVAGRQIVPVAGMAQAQGLGQSLYTNPLGSGLGVSVYDPEIRLGCLLHVVLPVSMTDPEAAELNPFLFVDTAIPRFFDEFFAAGGRRSRMRVKLVGAAVGEGVAEMFQIGLRNQRVLQSLFSKNQIEVHEHRLGGTQSRRMELMTDDGAVRLTCGREVWRL